MKIDKEKAITLVTEVIKNNVDNISCINSNVFCTSIFKNVYASDFISYYEIKATFHNKTFATLNKDKIGLVELKFNVDFVKFEIYNTVNDQLKDIGRTVTINRRFLFIPYKQTLKYIVKYPQIEYKLKINDTVIDLDLEEFNFFMSCYYNAVKKSKQQEQDQLEKQNEIFLDKLIKKYNV